MDTVVVRGSHVQLGHRRAHRFLEVRGVIGDPVRVVMVKQRILLESRAVFVPGEDFDDGLYRHRREMVGLLSGGGDAERYAGHIVRPTRFVVVDREERLTLAYLRKLESLVFGEGRQVLVGIREGDSSEEHHRDGE